MIIRDLELHNYKWSVKIYYAVTSYYIKEIINSLKEINAPEEIIKRVYHNLKEDSINTGFTYSNLNLRKAIIIIGISSSPAQFLNSFEHELRHLVDDIAINENLKMAEEDVAYLTGDINEKLIEDIQYFICK